MTAQIVSQSNGELTIEVKVSLNGTLLESEQSIVECVNQVGTLATGKALKRFDADGDPIVVGGVKLTARCQSEKDYQTPYGPVRVDRYVYQGSRFMSRWNWAPESYKVRPPGLPKCCPTNIPT